MLVLNGGSSSIKFAVFTNLQQNVSGKIDRIGLEQSTLTVSGHDAVPVAAPTLESAAELLMQWLHENKIVSGTDMAVHRVVHGMDHHQTEWVTPELLKQLKSYISFDPDHLPGELQLIHAVSRRFPQWKQVVCYDTAFHAALPGKAKMFALPFKYYEAGIRRYGFHGISYAYTLEQLGKITDRPVSELRIIMAHLGNGASMTAVKDGKSIDTTMGFTPAGGLAMGTRSGDLDPGICAWMMKKEHLSARAFNDLINHQSGLLGISGTSSDMRDLLQQKDQNERADQAVGLFCYQAQKWIGALSAALGGLDCLVFTGGIGENAPEIRSLICSDMEYLGLHLDYTSNESNEQVISLKDSPVTVYRIPTHEEYQMAVMATELLSSNKKN